MANAQKAADAPKPEFAPGARKVLADEIAKPFLDEIQAAMASCGDGQRPKLVGLLANGDPAAAKYAEWTGKTFKRDGLDYELLQVDPDDLEKALEEANRDNSVHGIMIYYPVFGARPCFHGGSYDDSLRDSVSLCKDVEGLCHFYRRTLYKNQRFVDSEQMRKAVLPCTPLAVVKILDHLGAYDETLFIGHRMSGKFVTVVNRSEVVGRPLAAMLANDGATVYSVDINSTYTFVRGKVEPAPEGSDTESLVRKSDVVVLGVPVSTYKMDPSWIKEGAIVVNVASCKNIDETALLTTRPGVRYVGAVGKVTIAMLERNLLRLHGNFNGCERLIWDSALGTVAPAGMTTESAQS